MGGGGRSGVGLGFNGYVYIVFVGNGIFVDFVCSGSSMSWGVEFVGCRVVVGGSFKVFVTRVDGKLVGYVFYFFSSLFEGEEFC